MTVEKNLIDSVNEETQYIITNLSLRNFYGLKLPTTKMTTFSVTDSNYTSPKLSPPKYQTYLSDGLATNVVNKLCCPEIINLDYGLYPTVPCTNCLKSVVLQPGVNIVTCPQSGKHRATFIANYTLKNIPLYCRVLFWNPFLKLDIIQMGKTI